MTATRELDWLPDHGEPPETWRYWLTKALKPASGWRIEKFLRHGRQRTDSCELVVVGPRGERRVFEIPEQKLLSTSASLRSTVVGVTDGLVRPDRMTQAELEDIWIALVQLATVTANQSKKDETREWLEQTVEHGDTDRLTDLTITASGRVRALEVLLARSKFDYLAARKFTDPMEINPRGPALLVDARTGERWMRVGEVATFWRHVIGVGEMSQPTIDGRLGAIGVRRHEYPFRFLGGGTRRVRLYRIGAAEETE